MNDLKAHHVPGLQMTGKRLTIGGGGHRGIMYFTPSTVTMDEALPILKKHGVEVYDVRGKDECLTHLPATFPLKTFFRIFQIPTPSSARMA